MTRTNAELRQVIENHKVSNHADSLSSCFICELIAEVDKLTRQREEFREDAAKYRNALRLIGTTDLAGWLEKRNGPY